MLIWIQIRICQNYADPNRIRSSLPFSGEKMSISFVVFSSHQFTSEFLAAFLKRNFYPGGAFDVDKAWRFLISRGIRVVCIGHGSNRAPVISSVVEP